MITLIVPNPAIELQLSVDTFTPNHTIRATSTREGIGSKAINAAVLLDRTSEQSQVFAFVAGVIGEKLKALVEQAQLQSTFIDVEGETELNTIVSDAGEGGETIITTRTLAVQIDDLQKIADDFTSALRKSDCVVISNTEHDQIPQGFYVNLIRVAHDKRVPVILEIVDDITPRILDALPDVIVVSPRQLQLFTGKIINTPDDAVRAVQIVSRHFHGDVLTCINNCIVASSKGDIFVGSIDQIGDKSVQYAESALIAGVASGYAERTQMEKIVQLGLRYLGSVSDVRDIQRFDRTLPTLEEIGGTIRRIDAEGRG